MTKDITACKLPVGPRDFFSFNPALWALDSTHGVRNGDRDIPERYKFKEPVSFRSIVTWPLFAAASTENTTIGSGLHLSDDMKRFTLRVKKDARVNERLDWLDFIEYGFDVDW